MDPNLLKNSFDNPKMLVGSFFKILFSVIFNPLTYIAVLFSSQEWNAKFS